MIELENELRRMIMKSGDEQHDRIIAISECLRLVRRHRLHAQNELYGIASSILDNWDDWDAEAQTEAQRDQDDRTWRFVMLTNLVDRMWRELGFPFHEEVYRGEHE